MTNRLFLLLFLVDQIENAYKADFVFELFTADLQW